MRTGKAFNIFITSVLFSMVSTMTYGQIINQPANIDNVIDKASTANVTTPSESKNTSDNKEETATGKIDTTNALGNNANPATDNNPNSASTEAANQKADPASVSLNPNATEDSTASAASNPNGTEDASTLDNAGFTPTAIVTVPANEKDTAVLEKLVKDWAAAFNKRDLNATCSLFSKKVVADYRGLPQKNYASICSAFKKVFADKSQKYEYKYKIHNIYRSGDLAVMRITWYLHISKNNTPIAVIQDEGMDVLTKNDKDQWQIINYQAYQK